MAAPSQLQSTDLLLQLPSTAAVLDPHHTFRTKIALTARIVRKRENAGAVALGPNVAEDEPVNVEPGHCILFRSSFESGAVGTYTYLRYGCIDDVNPVSGERDPDVLQSSLE